MRIFRIALSIWMILCLAASCALAIEYPEGTLYRGIEGYQKEVEFLQYQLFYAGYLGDDITEVDGVFGKKTEAAVRQFQKEHGIDVTGIVCPNTQNALDDEWENMMEPQGGEEESYPYCYVEHYANGTQAVVLCGHHMDIHAQAAAEMETLRQNGEQTLEGMQAAISVWLDELNALYEKWTLLAPDHARLIENHKEAFMDYYRAQMALWNAHFGAPSIETLERGMNMLSEQCCMLCIALSGAF